MENMGLGADGRVFEAAGTAVNEALNIQWYPGHMAKTKRMLLENVKLVDVVVELLDSRIPESSKNPDIDRLAESKPRIIIFNKADLANAEMTKKWKARYTSSREGLRAVSADSLKGVGMGEIVAAAKELTASKRERQRARGRLDAPIRMMIVGIPNVGKSTLINKLAGKAAAKTQDRPGVTRGKQWIALQSGPPPFLEMLDTPGILWPKFEDKEVGRRLAFTGAVKDDITDTYLLAVEFVRLIRDIAPNALGERYKIEPGGETEEEILEMLARSRGFLQKGGVPDAERAAIILLDEFRSGKLGRITLDRI